MVIAYLIVVQYIFNPVYQPRDNASNSPVQTSCTFINLSSARYISVYFGESVASVYLAFGFIGVDLLFFGMVMHLCGQLEILQKAFNTIGKSTWRSNFVRKMSILIKKHSKLIQLAKDIDTIYNFILLIQFSTSIFLVTSQGT